MEKVSLSLKKCLNRIKEKKIINIKDLYEAKKLNQKNMESLKTLKQLASEYHPSHAVYISVQNLVSVLGEFFTTFNEFNELSAKYKKAEEMYLPGYPPTSPVTKSFFTCWAFFDLQFGINKETIGSCVIDLKDILQIDSETLELIENLTLSRPGIYIHKGCRSDGSINLYEIFTNKEYRCYSTTTYRGKDGEIWLVRLAPPPFNINDLYITITTPYVISGSNQKDWEDYFSKTILKTKKNPPIVKYSEFMKYGPVQGYWNKYISLAYNDYADNVIYLEGLPGETGGSPHSSPGMDINSSAAGAKEENTKTWKN